MRVTKGLFATSVVLLTAGALGALATWFLVIGSVVLLVAAVVGAIASEERDLRKVDGVDAFERARSELASPPHAAA